MLPISEWPLWIWAGWAISGTSGTWGAMKMGLLDFIRPREKIVQNELGVLDAQIKRLSQSLQAEKDLIEKRTVLASLQSELLDVRAGNYQRKPSRSSFRKVASRPNGTASKRKTTSRTSHSAS